MADCVVPASPTTGSSGGIATVVTRRGVNEPMDVFALRDRVVDEYRQYVSGFVAVKERRAREFVQTYFSGDRLWPEPPVQLNPAFEAGRWVDELVKDGVLHPECETILVFTLLNYPGGPDAAGKAAAASLIAGEPQVEAAVTLLEGRFAAPDLDGPMAYAGFVADVGDVEEALRRRREAVATVRAFARTFRTAPAQAPGERRP